MIIQTISTMNKKYSIILLSNISLILLILSISQVSIYQYPPDAFYYFYSLPLTYWLGLSLLIGNISLFLLNKIHNLQLITILLFALYIYGFPNFIYEYPRYMDIYDHGRDFIPIVQTGHINADYDYANEYPTLFIFTAIIFNILNIDILSPFFFFKLFNISTLLFIILLIYNFTNRIINKHNVAVIGPFAFMALNWTPIGHFAPHTYSFMLYIIFFILLIHGLNNKDKKGIIISILLLFTINMTNPTNATILLLNLIFTIIGSLFLYKRITTLFRRLSVLTILMLIMWMWWTNNSHNVAIYNAERYLNNLIEGWNNISGIQIPQHPNQSLYLANTLRIIQTIFVSILLLIFSLLIIKKKLFNDNILFIFGIGSIIIFISIIMFASSALLTRIHVYLVFPLILLISYLMTKQIINKVKLILIIMFTGWFYISHITLYASEPYTYLDASLIYIGKILNNSFAEHGTVYAYSVSTFVVSYYFDTVDMKENLSSSQFSFDNYYITKNIDTVSSKFFSDKINFVLFSNVDANRLNMRSNDYVSYDILQINLNEKRFNLIMNTSNSKLYSYQFQ